MPKGFPLMPIEEALAIVSREAAPLGTVSIPIEEALGRVLAEPIAAARDMPEVDRSAMDGYAVRTADLTALPAELSVVDFLPAGKSAAGISVGPGQAVRIMTGAPVPPGADAVQKIEETEAPAGLGTVRVLTPVAAGENIFKRGEDVLEGEEVLRAGAPIRPAEIGALAAMGRLRVEVFRVPSACILSTGDEVVSPAVEPLPHQVRNSNGPLVAAALRAAGLAPISLGIAKDDSGELDRKLEEGLSGEILILIGGVSVGDRDLVAERLAAAGVRILFHGVAMKPGKPLLFGRRGTCLVFGLPGNPLSALTGYLLFVLPAIRGMTGLEGPELLELRARLRGTLRQKPGRTWYRLASIATRGTLPIATLVPSSSSGDPVSATKANGFVVVPAESGGFADGDEVNALLWPGFPRC